VAYTGFSFKKASNMSTAMRTKVLLLTPHLGGGGAERVIALLAHGLAPHNYDVHLGLATQLHTSQDPMPPTVHVHSLGAPRVRAAAFKLIRLVWRLKPDVILSGMFHLSFLVLLLRPLFPRGTSVLVRQNGTASAALAFGDLPVYTRLLYRLLYHRADRVICQSRAMASDIANQFGIADQRLAVLNNPVDIDAIRATMADPLNEPDRQAWPTPGPHLLAVGRLSREKGFDLLLSAMPFVRKQFPTADLIIVGSGPEEKSLKVHCSELDLESAVQFVGHVDRPSTYFSGASAFVLSSRHEGMPNALLEAAAFGLPLVALPACDGVSDLLRHQPGAWLASEVSSGALANSLLSALSILSPGRRFEHPFIEEFRMPTAIRAYERLIDSVAKTSIPSATTDPTLAERSR
jgi:glycosyltransferase involved in cell wall biosynthesis